jgi:hypothetical protein
LCVCACGGGRGQLGRSHAVISHVRFSRQPGAAAVAWGQVTTPHHHTLVILAERGSILCCARKSCAPRSKMQYLPYAVGEDCRATRPGPGPSCPQCSGQYLARPPIPHWDSTPTRLHVRCPPQLDGDGPSSRRRGERVRSSRCVPDSDGHPGHLAPPVPCPVLGLWGCHGA